MLAAIINADGRFAGLHFTWFDLRDEAAGRRFKADIVDPDSGEVLKAKKSRGTKQGGFIDLGGVPASTRPPLPPQGDRAQDFPAYRSPDALFERQFSGEGIESTLAVYTAMVATRRDACGIAWRAGIDLGNLCGAAADSARHPTLKDKAGRARRVPGPTPDMDSPAMPVIAGCRDYVQLADGDSDAFTTAQAMARGEARRQAQGVPVRTLWPPAGLDFNDWLLQQKARTA